LLSLLGLPITAGFLGKFYIFNAALESNLIWLADPVGSETACLASYYYLPRDGRHVHARTNTGNCGGASAVDPCRCVCGLPLPEPFISDYSLPESSISQQKPALNIR